MGKTVSVPHSTFPPQMTSRPSESWRNHCFVVKDSSWRFIQACPVKSTDGTHTIGDMTTFITSFGGSQIACF